MLGWEYPPNITGGLGVASQGIAEALANTGHQITFLLPKKSKKQVSKVVKLMDASTVKPDFDFWKTKKVYTEILEEIELGTRVLPYLPAETFEIARQKQMAVEVLESTEESNLLEQITLTGKYEADLGAELLKYAMIAVQVARTLKPTLIHAHDWITFRAGLMVKKSTGKPLVLHVHSTEIDRNSIHAQQFVVDEERAGFEGCDHILCVSERLKQTIVKSYHIAADKISVVPNAVTLSETGQTPTETPKRMAFIGRLTQQKSPSTFIDLARDLTSRGHDFEYLIVGDGHMRAALEQRVSTSNFAEKVTFTGFMDRTAVMKLLGEIDLLIMPSAAEPFGLVALEAVMKKVPVAAASGMGILEFVPSIPHVDRWDHFSYIRLVEKLMADLSYRKTVTEKCYKEASKLSWEKSTEKIQKVYSKLA